MMLLEDYGLVKGSVLRHYKGGVYQAEAVCLIAHKDGAGSEPALLYRHLFGSVTFCRPVSEMFEMVADSEGRLVRRFVPIPEQEVGRILLEQHPDR